MKKERESLGKYFVDVFNRAHKTGDSALELLAVFLLVCFVIISAPMAIAYEVLKKKDRSVL